MNFEANLIVELISIVLGVGFGIDADGILGSRGPVMKKIKLMIEVDSALVGIGLLFET